ncbi:hybrid sensor histidine kinase/response regulator [Limnohabitans lacus]|uniref:histidine kinase n=1 Tax=Limnohabitans lacus TaxID=3045173 RepID=A0ABT6X2I9_9BURK|nr:hybrid sensor histidine kinase/response regulator [Limnohabitans sp. HM2-2]MDI9232332.1 hybrid sensor histidine kinase/response regulator [Limnohabitans sp. HM2-2]
MSFFNDQSDSTEPMDSRQVQQVALEKISYMHGFAKTSTPATIIAPLLCIPLFDSVDLGSNFHIWLGMMVVAVMVRIFLIRSIRLDDNAATNFAKLNWAVGIVTSVWGLGWLMLVPGMDPVNYLIYQVISLTVLFVGMVGYCVHWKTFFSFALPLKITELLFIIIHSQFIIWPIAIGSLVNFYLALKMGFFFSKSWEKSMALRFKNEKLFDQLVQEKNVSVAANIAKSEFIATASHDLRQPMQAINIFVELLNLNNLKEVEKSIFQKMRCSITVLNKMFNTLLDISKLDSKMDTAYATFELDAMLDDLIPSFQQLAAEKKLDLRFDHEHFMIHGDANLLSQLLINLLSNALQYTTSGSVKVNFSNDQGKLVLTVSDTGCGIPEEDLPFIYKEFFRSQRSRPQHDGLGLGLSIVSRILHRTGGSVSVETEKDKGTVFTVHTHFDITGMAADSTPQLDPDTQAPLTSAKESPDSLHLGILENDSALMYAYLEFFVSQGYVVHPIPHEEAEFKHALMTIPKLDFILSDYRLGDKDGIYFIEQLREEFNQAIPACIVTADTAPQHLTLFKQLDIEVLYKPMDIASIAKFVGNRIG